MWKLSCAGGATTCKELEEGREEDEVLLSAGLSFSIWSLMSWTRAARAVGACSGFRNMRSLYLEIKH